MGGCISTQEEEYGKIGDTPETGLLQAEDQEENGGPGGEEEQVPEEKLPEAGSMLAKPAPSLASVSVLQSLREASMKEEEHLSSLCLEYLSHALDSSADPELGLSSLRSIRAEYEKQACILISKQIEEEGASTLHHLSLLSKMRDILWDVYIDCRGKVLKTQHGLFFVAFSSPVDAVKAALTAMKTLSSYNEGVESGSKIRIKIGVDAGEVLLLPNDLYGNPVNIASKLGDDTAQADELLVSAHAFSQVQNSSDLFSDAVEQSCVEISGVEIDYTKLLWKKITKDVIEQLDGPEDPSWVQKDKPISNRFSDLCLQRLQATDKAAVDELIEREFKRESVVFVSDMSGMTRISKSKGIIHFLSMIYKMREIAEPIFAKHNGVVVCTEADNFSVIFSDAQSAVDAACELNQGLEEINEGKEKNDIIKVCIGIDCGDVLFVAEEMSVFGHAVEVATDLGEEKAKARDILFTPRVKAGLTRLEEMANEGTLAEITPEDSSESYFKYRKGT